ncbi:hypothetical protein [Leptothrix discophora]|uniref:Uncharacterized protein n=1 Tax=Leptothrix discophora TaxID=89 RepID=A0ABT9G2N1_LEPDI|nr:hypothetical protein [Leptothrix discophora]MDP4300748.1 hypothetical protein [Leptothrix discophora]
MRPPKPKSFTAMTNCHPRDFVENCIALPVDVACDYIDRCYAKAADPSAWRHDYCVEAVWRLNHWRTLLDPSSSHDALEIAAYLRAFPPFDYEAYLEARDRKRFPGAL